MDLSGKRILVTGGASGLGAAAVRSLVRAGALVTITVRNGHGASDVPDGVRLASLDLADLASVRTFVEGWDGVVDVVVANAGVMAVPELRRSQAGWELQLATNFLGHFALITGLRGALAAAREPRVVIVSSGAQLRAGVDLDDLNFERRPYDPWQAYAQSKTADVLLAVGAARRWADDGIVANALAPGFILTNIQRHVPKETLRALGVMDESGAPVTPDFYKSPEQGAATTVLLAGSPLVSGVTGAYFEDNQESPVVEGGPDVATGVARWSIDLETADALWNMALAAVRS
ncbi:SDR family NAD(P)-dependent oxidoreductase [Curtobacterium sp. MCBD17_034]|uniref:SDR family NAD(P)-dependent oxidoreductase n=1 Tax=Curtobacterium sp. MCBD17_034 TaxID=2175672 RepID=UPI001C64F32F|nr:SDR family NAD(P)-dependent oxidoreductase [Curtobacterium sp. MCBD17_034]